jgi:hypothetical protein
MPTKKPYYKLVIGATPYTSADMRFPCGRIRIEVSDAHPERSKVIASLVAIKWGDMCEKVLAFFDSDRPADSWAYLTEPADRRLRDEVARLRALKGE